MRLLKLQPQTSSFPRCVPKRCTNKGCRVKSTYKCSSASQASIPHELPLFPVQPMGVFLPGMTKTLHLYEPHFVALMDECLASEHKFLATAVLEPYMGDSSNTNAGPGAFVGGYNFALSCGCLVKVLSAKPYTGGYLARIRGEARVGISGLPQTGPYMRAQVYPLPDQALAMAPEGEAQLRARVEQLREIMRDAQNLAAKFRCDETAALQQAMRWLHSVPITPGIQRTGGATRGVPSRLAESWIAASGEEPRTSGLSLAPSHRSASTASTASTSSSSCKLHNNGNGENQSDAAVHWTSISPSEDGDRELPGEDQLPGSRACSVVGNEREADSLPSNRAAAQQVRNRAGLVPTQADCGGQQLAAAAVEEEVEAAEDEALFELEEVVRLSWASLQWLPHSSPEERMYMVRTRLLAMDTRDVVRRLDLALDAMGLARASLAAKCAIKSM